MPILQNEISQLATALGLSDALAILFVICFPVLVSLVQYLIQKRYDSAQDIRIAKVQSDIDATQKQLQAKLDLKNHISRAQFDYEFEIYKKLWHKLIIVKNDYGLLEILLEDTSPDELKKQQIEHQKSEIANHSNDFNGYFHENMAFIVIDVINTCFAASKVMYNITAEDLQQGQPPKMIWNINRANMQKIEGSVYEVGGAIRERLANVTIID